MEHCGAERVAELVILWVPHLYGSTNQRPVRTLPGTFGLGFHLRVTAIVLCEPSGVGWQRVEMGDQFRILFRGPSGQQIADAKNLGPLGNVIADHVVTGLGQSLRNARGAGKAVEDPAGVHLFRHRQDMRNQLELGAGILDAFGGRGLACWRGNRHFLDRNQSQFTTEAQRHGEKQKPRTNGRRISQKSADG